MKANLRNIKKKLYETYIMLCYVNGIQYSESPQDSLIVSSISQRRL